MLVNRICMLLLLATFLVALDESPEIQVIGTPTRTKSTTFDSLRAGHISSRYRPLLYCGICHFIRIRLAL
jgi:hypothetical protein